MQFVYSDTHLGHDVTHETVLGAEVPAFEVVERAENIREALEADPSFERVAPTEHGDEPILAVHDPGLVRFLEEAWSELVRQEGERRAVTPDTWPNPAMLEGMSAEAIRAIEVPTAISGRAGWYGLDSSTPLVAGTFVAARGAVDVALTATDLVLGGQPAVYGLCRPPGHHAARALYAGYCFFNNAAIAAEALARATGEPVGILDVDFHHGNGTQQLFWRRKDVRYVSIHADPDRQYPYFLGRAGEIGEGPGQGENRNLPLPRGVDDAAYLEALDQALETLLEVASPFIVVSLGFDTFTLDPLGDFALTGPGYHEMGRRVAATGRRLVILQEGGYHRPTLGENARAWLRGAAGHAYDGPGA
jgi:acetoin utilization deacetylase AcuC-like enzyme